MPAVLLGSVAMADVPSVAVDIAPVHSLVARVMDGVGKPNLIIPPGATPHEYSLRPSEARALQEASLVFWMGEELTPWMDSAIETLSVNAQVTTLLEHPATQLLGFREGPLFAEDHAQGNDDRDESGGDAANGQEGYDPHAWLSPDNASVWLNVIAKRLSAVDPDNADAYAANALAGRAEIEALGKEVSATLDPVRGKSFVVFHDAYHYFEDAFDFPASGAISVSDASPPGPERIARIRDRVRDEGIDCVLAETQFNPGIVTVVLDGTDAKVGILSPIGSDLRPGKDFYQKLLRDLAGGLADCL